MSSFSLKSTTVHILSEAFDDLFLINENVNIDEKFNFKDISDNNFYKILTSLDGSKGRMKDDFPTEILLGTSDIICKPLNIMCNNAKKSEKFPGPLKTADVTPLPKDREKDNKKKYRPVSLTSILSKIFEKDLHEQISSYVSLFIRI